MRRIFIVLIIMAFLIIGCNTNNRGENPMHEYKLNENSMLYWLGHASFKIKTQGKTIYIDPYEIEDTRKFNSEFSVQKNQQDFSCVETADIVLITHSHYDHCSINDLKKIVGDDTVILAPGDCTSKFAGKVGGKLVLVSPNEKKNVFGILIETVPSYNVNKQFHPQQNAWVGYIVNVSGTRVYHAGDTDFISEMSNFNVDVALLPIGGTYTMDAAEAAKACDAINPKVAIPMHYNKIVGNQKSADEFKKLAKCNVEII